MYKKTGLKSERKRSSGSGVYGPEFTKEIKSKQL